MAFHTLLKMVAGPLALSLFSVTVSAQTPVTYKGNGFNFDGTTYNLNDERCGMDGQGTANDGGTGQFATWNNNTDPYMSGQGYLVWVLTANGATSAKLTLPTPEGEVTMFQGGGNFKFASQYYPYASLIGLPVTAIYEGKAKGNVNLVVSHGCQPYTTEGAWCSPGYWKNARDAAWTLTGVAKTHLFNDTVVPDFYDTASAADPTLDTVLNTSGANTFGAASGPYGLNAYNATGAFLTAQIPGYHFDLDLIGNEEACPIDNHGNFKQD
jgi:hypothetical protein